VSLTVFSFHQTWILSGPLSDDKERGFDPVVAQDVLFCRQYHPYCYHLLCFGIVLQWYKDLRGQ
jgi:hypothetical protein